MNRLRVLLVLALPGAGFLGGSLPGRVASPADAQTDSYYEVVFRVPVGPDGVHYEGGESPDTMRWGPQAFAVAPDGTFWIADSAAEPAQILSFTPEGELVGRIQLSGTVVGVSDIEVDDSQIVLLDEASLPPKVILLSIDGTLVGRYDIPAERRHPGGVTGIALGDGGEVTLEWALGETLTQLIDARGQVTWSDLDGYLQDGRLYLGDPVNIMSEVTNSGAVSANGRTVEIQVSHQLAGLRILGINDDGSFYVLADDLISGPAFEVDQTIHQYSLQGDLVGSTRVPEEVRYAPVAHELALGPDGSVYMMRAQPQYVEILLLAFAEELAPLEPPRAAENESLVAAPSAFSPTACRTRDSMVSVGTSYLNNTRYLDSYHINDNPNCGGRLKPHYLGGPGTYPSVSYDWGGWDSPSSFNTYMGQSGYFAGDINGSPEGCSRGTDCAGLISRAWALDQRYGTSPLYSQWSTPLGSTGELQRGDIMIRIAPPAHVIMYRSTTGFGMYGYESTILLNYDRVIDTTRDWGWLAGNGYTPRKYIYVCS